MFSIFQMWSSSLSYLAWPSCRCVLLSSLWSLYTGKYQHLFHFDVLRNITSRITHHTKNIQFTNVVRLKFKAFTFHKMYLKITFLFVLFTYTEKQNAYYFWRSFWTNIVRKYTDTDFVISMTLMTFSQSADDILYFFKMPGQLLIN